VKIYTKTGDEGSTGLYGGARVSKRSLRINALGDVDELNATLGWAAVSMTDTTAVEEVREIQRRLFDLGAELASPNSLKAQAISAADSTTLETSIDRMDAKLPPLRAFILPGGSSNAAHFHLARTVCRRAERSIIELHETEPVRDEVRIYINRLSDWLFTAARCANQSDQTAEIEWRPRASAPEERPPEEMAP
jgi:cob(I)alamin adenosyltransferase